MHPGEQALLESLSPEQIIVVAMWVDLEIALRVEDGAHHQVEETLHYMTERLQSLAPQSHLNFNDISSGLIIDREP